MTLYLVRHAKSDWNKPLMDVDRPLNDRGKREAVALGAELKRLGIEPDLILASSSKRTEETLYYLELEGELLEELYLADVKTLRSFIEYHPSKALMIIGHNPGLENLASELLREDIYMKTAHLLKIDTEKRTLELELRGKELL